MRRALKCLALALALVIVAAGCFCYYAARWLKQDDAPIKADAIVVLAGRFERSMHAADLYRAGQAPVVMLSEAVPDAGSRRLEELGIKLPSAIEVHGRILAAKGVPENAVHKLGGKALSTADEARAIAARFGKPGQRVLVVTSPSHVRRARMIVGDALQGAQLAVCATPYETFPDEWWRSQDAARDVLLEWSKIVFYQLGGRFRAQEASGPKAGVARVR
jgi:uncharacterized SAM-binding protein YcdF (DUF218 family)